MLIRQFAGGVVFYKDQVFVLQNDRGEWVLPKGTINGNSCASEMALKSIEEAGVTAHIVTPAGEPSCEFNSFSRQRPVCNRTIWFTMEADHNQNITDGVPGVARGGFFPVDEALEKITYSQDRSLIRVSYHKLTSIRSVVEKGA
ncbi:MAG: NUDIX hydrolase [Bacillota bacterium]